MALDASAPAAEAGRGRAPHRQLQLTGILDRSAVPQTSPIGQQPKPMLLVGASGPAAAAVRTLAATRWVGGRPSSRGAVSSARGVSRRFVPSEGARRRLRALPGPWRASRVCLQAHPWPVVTSSRRDSDPTWPELVACTSVAAVEYASGTWRRTAAEKDQAGWFSTARRLRVVAPEPDTELSFAYERPGRWRMESASFLYVDDGTTCWLREPEGGVRSAPTGRILVLHSPRELLVPQIDRERPGLSQLAPPPATAPVISAGELLGRPAWVAETDSGRFWVDDATGVLLRTELPDGSGSRFLDVDLDHPPGVDAFAWDGPSVPLVIPADSVPARPSAWRADPVPTLSWWPDPDQFQAVRVEPVSGRFLAVFNAAHAWMLWLGRGPLTGPGPEAPGSIVYGWTTTDWRYVLSADAAAGIDASQLREIAMDIDW